MDYSNSMLTVQNASNTRVTILYSNDDHPDYAATENNVAYYTSDNNIIYPDSTKTIFIPGKLDAWHNYINKGTKKKLYIYIFSIDELVGFKEQYSMNNLREMHKYLQVQEYTEQQLIEKHWIIDFKGN